MGAQDETSSFRRHVVDYLSSYDGDRVARSEDAVYTTSSGAPVAHPYESQRAGENGPLLLQDFHLIDLLSHFDRERIPERVVHAKGSGAHGFFECTNAIPDLTVADLFSVKGKRCPITIRFSTVGGEAGSPDAARDPRGFAIKFRTDEGIWDLVGNNTPVFFLRDPAKFPHFIHTQKRHPSTHLSHGDDSTMFWDYLSNNPESVHQLMILLGDRGVPDGYRKMHGYSGHTLKLVNKQGKWVYCQVHVKSRQGTAFLTEDELARNPRSPDYAQKDLYEAIARGDYPKWDVEIQTMTPQRAEHLWETQKINVFDLTHIWPHDQFPLVKPLTHASRNRAVRRPGPTKPPFLLPGYASASPRRKLPAAPRKCHIRQSVRGASFQRDGPMAFFNQGSRSNYLSSVDPIRLRPRTVDLDKTHGHFVGKAISYLSEIRPEDFNAPRALWQRVWDEPARQRFIKNTSGKLSLCRVEEFVKRQTAIFYEVDPDIAARLEKATGITGYRGIAGLSFNGTHNGLARDPKLRYANGVSPMTGKLESQNNGGPSTGTHKGLGNENRL